MSSILGTKFSVACATHNAAYYSIFMALKKDEKLMAINSLRIQNAISNIFGEKLVSKSINFTNPGKDIPNDEYISK